MFFETCTSCFTTSSCWYIVFNSAFARAEYIILYFLVGFAVTRWYIRSLIDHWYFLFSLYSTILTLSRLLRPLTYWVGFLGLMTRCFPVEEAALAQRGVGLHRARCLDAMVEFRDSDDGILFGEVRFIFLRLIRA